jgi:hypothetical protein
MSSESVNERLGRIEDKVDKMADAIVALARVEEKIMAIEQNSTILMKQVIVIDGRLTDAEKRQNRIELEQAKDSQTLSNLRKFFWVVLSAVLGGAFLVWFTNITTHNTAVEHSPTHVETASKP